ncbi:MAG: LamG domain-containing protein [Nanoarchaeales archaeon]|nr:LamG domain-containing protein [Nanoarchaeales archaeon]
MDLINNKSKLKKNIFSIFSTIYNHSKKAISTVVSLSLLLLTSIIIYTIVSSYFDLTLNTFELDNEFKNFDSEIEIIKVDGAILTLKNDFKNNLKLTSIKISHKECTLSSNTIPLGISELDIGDCTKDLSLETIYPIIISTQYGVIFENEIFNKIYTFLDTLNIYYITPTPTHLTLFSGNSIYVNITEPISNNLSTWTNLDDSLIGYWNFDSTNSTHVLDLSGNNYHGKIQNGAIIENTNKIRGYYGIFKTNPAQINITNFNWDNSGGPVTVSYWNYMETVNVDRAVLFSFGPYGVGTGDRFQAHSPWIDNFIYWDYGDLSTTGRITTNYMDYLDKWTLVTLVSEGNEGNFKAIYLDGELKNSATISDGPDKPLSNGLIGKGLQFNSHDGGIDELMIFNRVLSANEIKSLYDSKLNKFEIQFSNLDYGNHTFETCTIDINGNYGCLEERTIILS